MWREVVTGLAPNVKRCWVLMHDNSLATAMVVEMKNPREGFRMVYSRLGAPKPEVVENLPSLSKAQKEAEQRLSTSMVVPRRVLYNA